MSKSIDERIVEMQFDNKQFENGIGTSLKSIDKLKQGLNLDGAGKSLSNLSEEGKKFSLGGIADGVDAIASKFTALGIIGVTALVNITNAAVDAGKQLVKSLTVDPIIAGFTKYEEKVGAVQTIMNSTGKTIDKVSTSLEKLNWFTDETSYNFTDMVSNIGKFTSAGVDLDVSITAMQGIANAAALAGQGTNEASRAMYNFAQAIGTGSVKLIDWKSIENANMATVEFKQTIIDSAVAMGTLTKSSAGTYKTLTGTTVTVTDFNSALSEAWFTSDVLVDSLGKYGEYADAVFEIATEKGISCAEAMSLVNSETMQLGEKAFKAAQEAKTFTDAINATKDAVSTGWMNTFEIIFGNYVEAKELWTDLANTMWDVFASGAEERNEMLQDWKELGGRDSLIESAKNAFEALSRVLTPINEAFRDLFPKMTAERLYSLTEGLREFTEKIKIGDETADKLKRTFSGLFAILDIGKQAFGFLANRVGELVGILTPGASGVLGFTASIGDLLVSLNETIKSGDIFNKTFESIKTTITNVANAVKNDLKGMMETSFFQQLQSMVAIAADKLKEAFGHIKETFSGFGGIDLSGLKSLVDSAQEHFRPFTALGVVLSAAFEVIKNILEKVAPVFSRLASIVGAAFKALGDAVSNAFAGGGFQGVLDLINGGIFVGILLGIKKFIDSLSEITGNASGFLDGITGILDGVKDSLQAYQSTLKAKTLITIAGAIGILAAALVVLSLIDAEKLGVALIAITTLFIELAATMVVLKKALGSGDMVKVAGQMILMSAAILILATAMKSLAELDWEGVTKGAIGVGVLTAILVKASKALSDGSTQMMKGSVGLIAFSAAIVILTQAVKQMGELDAGSLMKGLTGVGVLMAEVAGFSQIVKPEKLTSTGIAMIAIGAAMNILVNAVSSFGVMDLAQLAKGLVAMGIVLAEIAGFSQIVKPDKLTSTGIAMIAMGAAMLIFAEAINNMGSLDLSVIAKGLATMAGSLAIVVVALNTMPANAGAKAASMLVLSAALVVLSQAMKNMGGMSWEEIAKSLVTLAGSLAIITVAMSAMTGGLAGAAAMMVMSVALLALAPALMMLGSMSLSEIGTALLSLVGVFAVVGGAAAILSPLTPAIIALAAGIALLGVGVAGIGAGLLAFSAGLTALAVSGTAGAAALVVIITSLLSLIPMVLEKIGEGIVAFAGVITAGMPAIMEAVKAIFEGLILLIGELIPPIVEVVLTFIDEMLVKLVEYVPKFVDSGMKIIAGFLQGIADNIQDVVEAAIDIMVNFLRGVEQKLPDVINVAIDIIATLMKAIGEETPKLVSAGFDMIISFINGLADTVREKTPEMVTAIMNLGSAIIEGLVSGLMAGVKGVVDTIVKVGKALIDGFKNLLGINSPSTIFKEFAGNIISGLVNGITNGISSVIDAAKRIGSSVINTVSGIFDGIGKVASNIVDGLVNGLKNGVSSIVNAAKNVAQSAFDAAKNFLGINSPSTKFIWLGENSGEGMVVGLENMAGAVGNAAASVGDSAVTSLGKAMNGVADILDSDMDTSPTIRPVFDLTDVKAGITSLDQLLLRKKSFKLDLATVSATIGSANGTAAIREKQTSTPPTQIINQFDCTGMVVREEADIDRIADKLYQRQMQTMRGRGARGTSPT